MVEPFRCVVPAGSSVRERKGPDAPVDRKVKVKVFMEQLLYFSDRAHAPWRLESHGSCRIYSVVSAVLCMYLNSTKHQNITCVARCHYHLPARRPIALAACPVRWLAPSLYCTSTYGVLRTEGLQFQIRGSRRDASIRPAPAR